MKSLAKRLASRMPTPLIERALALSLLSDRFRDLHATRAYDTREQLWLDVLSKARGPVTFLEFGVWQGYSIDFFARHNSDPASTFWGFDSFEGLPEDWGAIAKGHFDQGGGVPRNDDPRVGFVKGWFQNTVPPFLGEHAATMAGDLVVHYDADLYSSTLYCLTMVDTLKRDYLAVFDEFTGHETRALHNYCQASGAQVEFLGRNGQDIRWPDRVSCRIRPVATYEI